MKTLCFFALLVGCGASSATGVNTPGDLGTNDDAQEQLEHANELYAAMSLRIDCMDQGNLEDFVACVTEQLRAVVVTAEETSNEYSRVLRYDDPQWSVSALAGQARTYRAIAAALVAIEVPEIYPTALLEEGVQMSDEARQVAHEQVVIGVRTLTEHRSLPIICAAAIFDVRALRLAKAHGVDVQYSQGSNAQLSVLNDHQISVCVDQGRSADHTLMAYSPGEFDLQR